MMGPQQNKAVQPESVSNAARRLASLLREEDLPADMREDFRELLDTVLRVGERGLSQNDRERLESGLKMIQRLVGPLEVKHD